MTPIGISQVSFDDLSSFFKSFDFTQDSAHIQKYISFIQEASFATKISYMSFMMWQKKKLLVLLHLAQRKK
jgi:hypothetical protein